MDAFNANDKLIRLLGQANAHLVWVLGLYIEAPDLESLASEGLTDGPEDKKIDFIFFEPDTARIILAQGYYSSSKKDAAPSNRPSLITFASYRPSSIQ